MGLEFDLSRLLLIPLGSAPSGAAAALKLGIINEPEKRRRGSAGEQPVEEKPVWKLTETRVGPVCARIPAFSLPCLTAVDVPPCPCRIFKLERTDGEGHPRLARLARVLRSGRRAESARPSSAIGACDSRCNILVKS